MFICSESKVSHGSLFLGLEDDRKKERNTYDSQALSGFKLATTGLGSEALDEVGQERNICARTHVVHMSCPKPAVLSTLRFRGPKGFQAAHVWQLR